MPEDTKTKLSIWDRYPELWPTVRSLWLAGHTGDYILRAVKCVETLTRSALMGKISRMGLTRNSTGVRPPKAVRERITQAKKEKARVQRKKERIVDVDVVEDIRMPSSTILDLPPETTPTQVSLLDAKPHQCRWPIGAQLYCGDNILEGTNLSYCTRHFNRAVSKQYRNVAYATYRPRYR